MTEQSKAMQLNKDLEFMTFFAAGFFASQGEVLEDCLTPETFNKFKEIVNPVIQVFAESGSMDDSDEVVIKQFITAFENLNEIIHKYEGKE